MKRFLLGVIFTLVTLVAIGAASVYFGWISLNADVPVAGWDEAIIGQAAEIWFDRHTPKASNPVEVNDGNLLAGAKIYNTRCGGCHGTPEAPVSPVYEAFYPRPPQFLTHTPHDPDHVLFHITKHGIRWTAMPAHKNVLDDGQIWTVVTFLRAIRKLPPAVDAEWRKGNAPPPSAPEHDHGTHKH